MSNYCNKEIEIENDKKISFYFKNKPININRRFVCKGVTNTNVNLRDDCTINIGVNNKIKETIIPTKIFNSKCGGWMNDVSFEEFFELTYVDKNQIKLVRKIEQTYLIDTMMDNNKKEKEDINHITIQTTGNSKIKILD